MTNKERRNKVRRRYRAMEREDPWATCPTAVDAKRPRQLGLEDERDAPRQQAALKAGDVVDVYEDPITREELEGRAKLLKLLSRDPRQLGRGWHIERWEVQFEGTFDGDVWERAIRVDNGGAR